MIGKTAILQKYVSINELERLLSSLLRVGIAPDVVRNQSIIAKVIKIGNSNKSWALLLSTIGKTVIK